jgi:hypothetical protein
MGERFSHTEKSNFLNENDWGARRNVESFPAFVQEMFQSREKSKAGNIPRPRTSLVTQQGKKQAAMNKRASTKYLYRRGIDRLGLPPGPGLPPQADYRRFCDIQPRLSISFPMALQNKGSDTSFRTVQRGVWCYFYKPVFLSSNGILKRNAI